ncbi:MAG: hypothetical protein IKT05_03530 [Fibrobacter sp.]|nr:hypothetical protein [Fibrobacter sp.]
MIWFWGVLCALALVALFFPFIFWIDFSIDFKGVTVGVRFFKKEVYTYTKHFKKEKSSEEEDVSVGDEVEATASAPAPKVEKAEPPKPVEKKEETKSVEKQEPPKKETEASAPKISAPTSEEKSSVDKSSDDEKEEKRSLTDEEFWTLLLTPEFDARAWWAVRHALSALFKLFRIRFVDCFVEGIRMAEYDKMGYAAALNGFLKSFPYIGAWDFRMDWTCDHEPKAAGHVRASLNLCRVLGLVVTILFFGGIVAFTFWRRRARILKTGELPELGFIRGKIVKMMSEED